MADTTDTQLQGETLEPPERIRVVVRAATSDDWIGVAYCKDFTGDPSTIHQYVRAVVTGPRATYESAHPARYTMTHAVHPDIVVLWFLALKSHWFEDSNNMFFGMREQAKAYLYKWVETGELADDNTTLEIATAMKFREWLASSWATAATSSPTPAEIALKRLQEDRCGFCGGKTEHKPDCDHGVAPAERTRVVEGEQERKLARKIIDAVINSPCVVEVRMFSQPDAVDHLEDAIIALLPAAPPDNDFRTTLINLLKKRASKNLAFAESLKGVSEASREKHIVIAETYEGLVKDLEQMVYPDVEP